MKITRGACIINKLTAHNWPLESLWPQSTKLQRKTKEKCYQMASEDKKSPKFC